MERCVCSQRHIHHPGLSFFQITNSALSLGVDGADWGGLGGGRGSHLGLDSDWVRTGKTWEGQALRVEGMGWGGRGGKDLRLQPCVMQGAGVCVCVCVCDHFCFNIHMSGHDSFCASGGASACRGRSRQDPDCSFPTQAPQVLAHKRKGQCRPQRRMASTQTVSGGS